MGKKKDLVEKSICRKCSIVFEKAAECPRCGKSDMVDTYFDFDN
jgi:RNA polymerase subunit RPABC4/transcription elongation factor Spt4